MLQPSALVRCFQLNISGNLHQTNIYVSKFIDTTNWDSGSREASMTGRYNWLRDVINDPVSFFLFAHLPKVIFCFSFCGFYLSLCLKDG